MFFLFLILNFNINRMIDSNIYETNKGLIMAFTAVLVAFSAMSSYVMWPKLGFTSLGVVGVFLCNFFYIGAWIPAAPRKLNDE